MIRNVFIYHRSGPDKRITPQGNAADNSGIGADRRALFDQSRAKLVYLSYFRPGVVDIGKYHGRPAENAVFQSNSFIDADVVLNLAVVADNNIRPDQDILADIAILANFCTRQDVGEMPDFCSLADLAAIVDVGGFMDEVVGDWWLLVFSHKSMVVS